MKIGVFIGSAPMSFGEPKTTTDLVDYAWGQPSESPTSYQIHGVECLVISRHGAKGDISPHNVNYRANIWHMHKAGVDCIIGTHTVGSIDPSLDVGALVIPEDLIDYTWGRPSTYDDERRHIEFTQPYDQELQEKIVRTNSQVILGGVYGCTQGPRLETPAEIRRMGQDGCTLVGMTGMPEASLARELSIPFVSVCLVVNPAAGVVPGEVDMEALRQTSEQGARDFVSLIEAFCLEH